MSDEATRRKVTAYKNILRGSAWAVGMRWAIRAVGFVSVVILARLLTPADFGVAAMGSLVIGFVAGFSELGVQMLLIRDQDATREHTDTAWTIKILQGLFVALVVALLAPVAALYFDETRVIPVMWLLALTAALNGTENIGLVLARKDLDFALDFRFNVYKRLISFVATIALAFALRNYWALVIGQLVSAVLCVPLSFGIHPYRPRLCLARSREYFAFAGSIIPLKIGRFLYDKTDVLVVGRLAGTTVLGVYHVAAELSSIVTREIVTPMARGLMPNFARMAERRDELAAAYLKVLGAVALLVVPVGYGLAAVAPDFVAVLLGDQWGEAVPLIRWLAAYGTLASLIHLMSGQILIVTRRERLSAALMWVRVGLLLPFVIGGMVLFGPVGVAAGAAVSAALMLPVSGFFLVRTLPVNAAALTGALWRPLIAGAIMAGSLRYLHLSGIASPFLRLALDATMAAGMYVAVLLLLWWLAGRPEGIERAILALLEGRLRKRSARADS